MSIKYSKMFPWMNSKPQRSAYVHSNGFDAHAVILLNVAFTQTTVSQTLQRVCFEDTTQNLLSLSPWEIIAGACDLP